MNKNKKYKIVEHKFIRNIGEEDSIFYIKQKVFGFLWWYYYEKPDYDDIDTPRHIVEKIIFYILSILPMLMIIGILVGYGINNGFISTGIVFSILALTNYIYHYIKRVSYNKYIDAELGLKNIIKKNIFRDITQDVVEITTVDNKIIFEKR